MTQIAHALQCALQAEQAGASAAMITASLLHDIGHLLNPDAGAAIDRVKMQGTKSVRSIT